MPPARDTALARMLERATFGHRSSAWDEAVLVGFDGWVAQQLEPGRIDDAACDALLAGMPSLRHSAAEIFRDFHGPLRDLRAAALIRAVHSQRQLFERVVELWNDHFCIDAEKGDCRILAGVYDRTAIRAHALGKFGDLVTAVAQSGAMLESLDNRKSRKEAANENFARELLELHTLGTGNYTETDVREAARCFTGWSTPEQTEAGYGEFVFRPECHDDGTKRVLGKEIAAGGGAQDGMQVIALAVAHPACAHRVARKLCRHFVGESPEAGLVERVARTYASSQGDIAAMLRVILSRSTFEAATAASLEKYKRPFHFVAGLLRATDARIGTTEGLLDELADLGHLPFAWPTPDGCPDVREAWEPMLMARWRLADRFFSQSIRGVGVDLDALVRGTSPHDVVERVDLVLTGGRMPAADRDVLRERIHGVVPIVAEDGRELFTLAACSPGYQVLSA